MSTQEEARPNRKNCPNCGRESKASAKTCQWCNQRFPVERVSREGMPVATSNEIPGYEITGYVREVYGVVVRSRGAAPRLGAGLASVVGGEIETMTNLLSETRRIAIERMVEEAEQRGADAIIAMRLDVTDMSGNWTEVCAYGTAVRAHVIAQ